MTRTKRLMGVMRADAAKAGSCKVALNILGYREDRMWVALALEMDLRGYGRTFEAALDHVRELVAMQISFAHFKGQLEMILKPADPVWFGLFAEARSACLSAMLESPRRTGRVEYQVAGLPIPSPHVIEAIRREFAQADA
jgi:hypothetical protein